MAVWVVRAAVSRDMPMFTTDAAVVDELQKGQPAVEGH